MAFSLTTPKAKCYYAERRCAGRQADRQAGRQADRKTGRQADRTNGWTDRQTERQTDIAEIFKVLTNFL
jgi:hypothetical protein